MALLIKLGQVTVQGLPGVASDCTNILKAIIPMRARQSLSTSELSSYPRHPQWGEGRFSCWLIPGVPMEFSLPSPHSSLPFSWSLGDSSHSPCSVCLCPGGAVGTTGFPSLLCSWQSLPLVSPLCSVLPLALFGFYCVGEAEHADCIPSGSSSHLSPWIFHTLRAGSKTSHFLSL